MATTYNERQKNLKAHYVRFAKEIQQFVKDKFHMSTCIVFDIENFGKISICFGNGWKYGVSDTVTENIISAVDKQFVNNSFVKELSYCGSAYGKDYWVVDKKGNLIENTWEFKFPSFAELNCNLIES